MILVLLSISFFSIGQKLIHECDELKVGIYKNFNEFKTNSPSIEFNYQVICDTIRYKIPSTRKRLVRYKIDIDKKTSKTIGNVFGFCDGKHVYINDKNPRLRPRTNFSRIERLAPYCYFVVLDKAYMRGGGQYGGSFISFVSEKLVNIDTGEILDFTRRNLREEILVHHEELLHAFDNEKKYRPWLLMKYYLKYLEELKE